MRTINAIRKFPITIEESNARLKKIIKENEKRIRKGDSLLLIPCDFGSSPDIEIIDKRDIKEFNRRMRKKTCQPLRNELYSVNPDFNGVYSDPQNR